MEPEESTVPLLFTESPADRWRNENSDKQAKSPKRASVRQAKKAQWHKDREREQRIDEDAAIQWLITDPNVRHGRVSNGPRWWWNCRLCPNTDSGDTMGEAARRWVIHASQPRHEDAARLAALVSPIIDKIAPRQGS